MGNENVYEDLLLNGLGGEYNPTSYFIENIILKNRKDLIPEDKIERFNNIENGLRNNVFATKSIYLTDLMVRELRTVRIYFENFWSSISTENYTHVLKIVESCSGGKKLLSLWDALKNNKEIPESILVLPSLSELADKDKEYLIPDFAPTGRFCSLTDTGKTKRFVYNWKNIGSETLDAHLNHVIFDIPLLRSMVSANPDMKFEHFFRLVFLFIFQDFILSRVTASRKFLLTSPNILYNSQFPLDMNDLSLIDIYTPSMYGNYLQNECKNTEDFNILFRIIHDIINPIGYIDKISEMIIAQNGSKDFSFMANNGVINSASFLYRLHKYNMKTFRLCWEKNKHKFYTPKNYNNRILQDKIDSFKYESPGVELQYMDRSADMVGFYALLLSGINSSGFDVYGKLRYGLNYSLIDLTFRNSIGGYYYYNEEQGGCKIFFLEKMCKKIDSFKIQDISNKMAVQVRGFDAEYSAKTKVSTKNIESTVKINKTSEEYRLFIEKHAPFSTKANEEYFGLDNPLRNKLIDFVGWIRIQREDRENKNVDKEFADHQKAIAEIINVEKCSFVFIDGYNAFSVPSYVDPDIFPNSNKLGKDASAKDIIKEYQNAVDKIEDLNKYTAITKTGYRFENPDKKHVIIGLGLDLFFSAMSNKERISFTDEEIAAILAHEIGHFMGTMFYTVPMQILNDIERGITMSNLNKMRSVELLFSIASVHASAMIKMSNLALAVLGGMRYFWETLIFLPMIKPIYGLIASGIWGITGNVANEAEKTKLVKQLKDDKPYMVKAILDSKVMKLPSRDNIVKMLTGKNNTFSKFKKSASKEKRAEAEAEKIRPLIDPKRSFFSGMLYGINSVYLIALLSNLFWTIRIVFYLAMRNLSVICVSLHLNIFKNIIRRTQVKNIVIGKTRGQRTLTSNDDRLIGEIYADYFATAHALGVPLQSAMVKLDYLGQKPKDSDLIARMKHARHVRLGKFETSSKNKKVIDAYVKLQELRSNSAKVAGKTYEREVEIMNKSEGNLADLTQNLRDRNGVFVDSTNLRRIKQAVTDNKKEDSFYYSLSSGYLDSPARIKSFYDMTKKELDSIPNTEEYKSQRKELEYSLIIMEDTYRNYINNSLIQTPYLKMLRQQLKKEGMEGVTSATIAGILVDTMNQRTAAYSDDIKPGGNKMGVIRKVYGNTLNEDERKVLDKIVEESAKGEKIDSKSRDSDKKLQKLFSMWRGKTETSTSLRLKDVVQPTSPDTPSPEILQAKTSSEADTTNVSKGNVSDTKIDVNGIKKEFDDTEKKIDEAVKDYSDPNEIFFSTRIVRMFAHVKEFVILTSRRF